MNWLPVTLLCAFSLATADTFTKCFLVDYSTGEVVMIRFGFCGLVLSALLLVESLPAVPLVFWGWVDAAILMAGMLMVPGAALIVI